VTTDFFSPLLDMTRRTEVDVLSDRLRRHIAAMLRAGAIEHEIAAELNAVIAGYGESARASRRRQETAAALRGCR